MGADRAAVGDGGRDWRTAAGACRRQVKGGKLSGVTTPDLRAADEGAHYPGSSRRAPAHTGPWLVALALPWILAACGHHAVRHAAPGHRAVAARAWPTLAPADPARANEVVIRALSLVGTPYRYGGDSPAGGFDCSGLVNYVYRDMLDLRLPRNSRELARFSGPRISETRLVAADLVFFGDGSTVSHVGIYVGGGRFVHAPSTGGTVRLDALDGPYWRDHYSGARRVLE